MVHLNEGFSEKAWSCEANSWHETLGAADGLSPQHGLSQLIPSVQTSEVHAQPVQLTK